MAGTDYMSPRQSSLDETMKNLDATNTSTSMMHVASELDASSHSFSSAIDEPTLQENRDTTGSSLLQEDNQRFLVVPNALSREERCKSTGALDDFLQGRTRQVDFSTRTVHKSRHVTSEDLASLHAFKADTSISKTISPLRKRRVYSMDRFEDLTINQTDESKDGNFTTQQIRACDIARKVYHKEMTQRERHYSSRLLDMTKNFPHFLESELVYGEILGKGGFATVREVRGLALFEQEQERTSSASDLAPSVQQATKAHFDHKKDPNRAFPRSRSFVLSRADVPDREVPSGDWESRKFMSQNVFRKEGHARYAVKKLSLDIINDPEELVTGLADMVSEARILSAIEHPNIIKLRALQAGDPFRPDFFIIMDRLYETLDQRIQVWRQEQSRKKHNKLFSGITKRLAFRHSKISKASSYRDRVVSAFHLASALKYLHQHRLIHRDLKPENIGFDCRGDIKIFDFGLARELPSLPNNLSQLSLEERRDAKNKAFLLTGFCGSPRYMAPEVALRQPYNEKSDVYSFGILFWELLSLQVPFASHRSYETMFQEVWKEPYMRPSLQRIANVPETISELIKEVWAQEAPDRPSMKTVAKCLKEECLKFPDVSLESLGHRRRRSRVIYDRENACFRLNTREFEGKLREYRM